MEALHWCNIRARYFLEGQEHSGSKTQFVRGHSNFLLEIFLGLLNVLRVKKT